jgi:hypothetical protein
MEKQKNRKKAKAKNDSSPKNVPNEKKAPLPLKTERVKESSQNNEPINLESPQFISSHFHINPIALSHRISPLEVQMSNEEFYSFCFETYRRAIEPERISQLSPICKGYLNSGNTCFVNCVLQSMLSLPRLVRLVRFMLPALHFLLSLAHFFRFILEFKEVSSTSQLPSPLPTWIRFLSLALASFTVPQAAATPPPQQPQKKGSQKLVVTSAAPVSQAISPCWTEYLGPLVECFRQDLSPMSDPIPSPFSSHFSSSQGQHSSRCHGVLDTPP